MDRFIFAQSLAKEAGAIAHGFFKNYSSLSLQEKEHPQDLVSEADLAVEKFIIEKISALFPDDGFLGEETGLVEKNNNYWVIDPIDGTANFVRGFRYYCISIAFVSNGAVDFGVVFDPCADELFYARRGNGAFIQSGDTKKSIHVDDCHFNRAIIEIGRCREGDDRPNFELLKKVFEKGAGLRHFGAGALALAHIGAGRLSACYETFIKPWDAFAGSIICEEAGAVANDYMESLWKDGGEVFVCVPSIAEEFKSIIRETESNSTL